MLPGTVMFAGCGAFAGGMAAAVATPRVLMKKVAFFRGLHAGTLGAVYFMSATSISKRVPEEHWGPRWRLPIHMASGSIAGMLAGLATRAMLPCTVAGAVCAVPIWYLVEGRLPQAPPVPMGWKPSQQEQSQTE